MAAEVAAEVAEVGRGGNHLVQSRPAEVATSSFILVQARPGQAGQVATTSSRVGAAFESVSGRSIVYADLEAASAIAGGMTPPGGNTLSFSPRRTRAIANCQASTKAR